MVEQSYRILPVSLVIFFVYVLSWWFMKEGILSTRTFRKFWNVLLLLTFLSTALLGILLVVNIDFKLDISWIKKILIWHVEFGIAMAITGLFHLLWHWNYFIALGKHITVLEIQESAAAHDRTFPEYTSGSAIYLGFTALFSQLLFLRQFLDFFGSMELVAGMIIAAWMIYSGLGAWVGYWSRRKCKDPDRLFILHGFLPFLLLLISWVIKAVAVPKGSLTSPYTVLLFSLLFAPIALLSGYLFARLSAASLRSSKTGAVRTYYSEALGSMLAGILYTLCSHWLFSTLLMALFPSVLALFIPRQRYQKFGSRITHVILPAAISLVILLSILLLKCDTWLENTFLPAQKILFTHETPVGRLTLAEKDGQLNYYNGSFPLWSSGDVINREEQIHYAMLQKPNADNVLVIAGNFHEADLELEKYHPKKITNLSLSCWFEKFLPDSLKMTESNIITISMDDPVHFLLQTKDRYDVVFLNVGDPITAFLNKFYTNDFMLFIKSRMTSEGVICMSLSTAMNYQDAAVKDLNASLLFSLRHVFGNCLIIPGNRLYFLASHDSLRLDIAEAVKQSGLKNEYVSDAYIEDDLLADRSRRITMALDSLAPANSLWQPGGYYRAGKVYLSQFQVSLIPIAIFLLLLSGIVLMKSSRGSWLLFGAGFASAGLEYLVLAGYQTAFGNLSQEAGLIFALFMAGTALGSFLWTGIKNQRYNLHMVLLLNLLIMLLFPMLLGRVNPFMTHRTSLLLLFFSQIFTLAFIIGSLFTLGSLQTSNRIESGVGQLYGSDLAGSAWGMLAFSLFVFPLFGIWGSMALLVLFGFILLLTHIAGIKR